jgi:hypothetical protein
MNIEHEETPNERPRSPLESRICILANGGEPHPIYHCYTTSIFYRKPRYTVTLGLGRMGLMY